MECLLCRILRATCRGAIGARFGPAGLQSLSILTLSPHFILFYFWLGDLLLPPNSLSILCPAQCPGGCALWTVSFQLACPLTSSWA